MFQWTLFFQISTRSTVDLNILKLTWSEFFLLKYTEIQWFYLEIP